MRTAKSMQVNPEHEALFQAALADRNGHRPRAAIRKFRALLRQNDEIPGAYLLLGDIQNDLGYHAAAVTSFSQAVRLRPISPLCSVGLILALLDKGDFNGARKEVNRFLKIKESKEHREFLKSISYLSQNVGRRCEFMSFRSTELSLALLYKGDFNGALRKVSRYNEPKESKEHRKLFNLLSGLSQDADKRREFMAALSRRKSRKPSRKPASKK